MRPLQQVYGRASYFGCGQPSERWHRCPDANRFCSIRSTVSGRSRRRVLVLSHAPATILADLPVDLPAARDQITTRQSAEFVARRTEIARLLHTGELERSR